MAEMIVEPASLKDRREPWALSVRGVEKVFGRRGLGRKGAGKGAALTRALADVSFDVADGEFTAIMGPSGSGKTTLLNCISTIDRPTSGSIMVGQRVITSMSRRQLAAFRREELGFVFQDSNLLTTLNGFENIALALTIRRRPAGQIPDQVRTIAETLGVEDALDKFPGQMSGGQRQRLAAARAIVTHPRLILADEPTGALDSRNATIMLETLGRMNRLMGATILMVTHDAYAASFTDRVLFLKDGRLFNELRRGDRSRQDFFTRIMEIIAFLGGESASRETPAAVWGATDARTAANEAGDSRAR